MEASMRRLSFGVLVIAILIASSLSAQDASRDADTRIRRAASSADNAIAVRQCVPQATELREIAAAARAERRPIVRAALLASIDNRDAALESCRDAIAPEHPRGRMMTVIGASMERGFGQMDMSPLLIQFVERQGEFLACYERMLSTHIGTSGRVSVEVTARQNGGPLQDVHVVENTLGDPQVGACVERVVRGFRELRPGPTGGDVTFRFPLEFEPAT
jgi:hypothetical protein